jgi:hypothetical protein
MNFFLVLCAAITALGATEVKKGADTTLTAAFSCRRNAHPRV